MNDSNLVPLSANNERTKRIAKMGGEASGEARRQKKLMRERLEVALEMPHFDLEGNETTKGEAVVASLVQKAIDGDTSAARLIVQTLDGLPTATVAVEQPIPDDVYARVAAALERDE